MYPIIEQDKLIAAGVTKLSSNLPRRLHEGLQQASMVDAEVQKSAYVVFHHILEATGSQWDQSITECRKWTNGKTRVGVVVRRYEVEKALGRLVLPAWPERRKLRTSPTSLTSPASPASP